MEIRMYRPHDCISIMQLFFEIVRTADMKQYPKAQLKHWATVKTDPAAWSFSLAQHYTVVAEKGQKLVGYGQIAPNGYFQSLFVHPNCQHEGIASQMADCLEKMAEENAIGVIFTQLTNPSRLFFANRGYKVMKTNTIEKYGQQFHTFIMRKIMAY